MTITIEKKTDAALLDKTIVEGYMVSEDVMPSKKEVQRDIAAQMNVAEELVSVDHIYPVFGLAKASIIASVYRKPETKTFFRKKEKKAPTTPGGGQ